VVKPEVGLKRQMAPKKISVKNRLSNISSQYCDNTSYFCDNCVLTLSGIVMDLAHEYVLACIAGGGADAIFRS